MENRRQTLAPHPLTLIPIIPNPAHNPNHNPNHNLPRLVAALPRPKASAVQKPILTSPFPSCIRNRMTEAVSLRMPSSKLAAVDRRAADSGLDRSKYLLRLVIKTWPVPLPNPGAASPARTSLENIPPTAVPMLRFARGSSHTLKKIADSGLLIAALDARNPHHAWARNILKAQPPPWLVCEPVLIEVSVSVGTPEPVLEKLSH